MLRAGLFISLAANAILVVLLATSSPAPPAPPAIVDLLDDAATQSCEEAKHLKEYDPRKHTKGSYVAEVDPPVAAKRSDAVITYKLIVRCFSVKE